METRGVSFLIPPHVRYEGKPNELASLFVCDPSGNVLEFKAIRAEYERIKSTETEAYGLNYEYYDVLVINYIFTLGTRLASDDRFEDALSVLSILPEDYPDMSGIQFAYSVMGEAHLRLHDFQAARASFEKVLEYDRDNEEALRMVESLKGASH